MTPPRPAPLVSVVTPFYNTADHLRECIESVLAQTYQNIEYVLQDNASDDGSTEIALEYARKDPRVRYFRLDELIPQMPNYNLAVRRISAQSSYCKIVQADDWITADCLRQMVALGERAPSVGLISALRFKGETVAGDGIPYTTTVLPGRDAARIHLLTNNFLFGSPSTVMYRSDAIRQREPFFPEDRLNEDTETCYEILRDWDFGFVHQVLSYTRMDSNSVMGRVEDKDPFALGRMIRFHRYGRDFLDLQSYESELLATERRYYRQLAKAVLSFRNDEYWDFQRAGLATQKLTIEPLKLSRGLGRELLSLLSCPRQILDYVLARRPRRPA